MTTDCQFISVERDGETCWVKLKRPERLNAFSQDMHRELARAMDAIEASPPRVLVLTGAGRGFCAGQDLTERYPQIASGEEVALGDGLERNYNALIRRLDALPSVIVAVVNGVCAGAGLGLALAADIIVASREAKFLLAFGKIGLGPDAGVSWGLPRVLGPHRALGLMLTSAPMSAEEAYEWGLVFRVATHETLHEETLDIIKSLLAGSPEAQARTKALIRQPAGTLAEQLDRERDSQDALGRTDFYRQAVLNFGAPKT